MRTYACAAVTSKTDSDLIRQLRLKSGKRVSSSCERWERSLVESQLKSDSDKFCWQHELPSGLDFKNNNRIKIKY